jgi:D-3-phosphoglycerate dehydrogenase / 2-oxoglutarate reductase
MKVLVADKFEPVGLEGLRNLGCEVEYNADLKGETLAQAVRETGAEILVVRSTEVPESVMEGSRLSVIIRAGAGYNTIDVAAASRLGIYVTNCPGKNSQAVAELAFGLMLAVDRHVAECAMDLRRGVWNKKAYSKAAGLYGRTLGLIGMGKIGQEMIPRAKAFGMNVIAYSRWMTPDVAAALGIGRASSPEEVASLADFVSVHVSLTADTKGMLGAGFFEAMRPGAVFVNTSRAEVVDQEALLHAVREKGVRAGLDVFEGEPKGGEGDYEGALKDEAGVICTHHIGASTDQAQEAVAMEVVRIVREYRHSGSVPNVVNVKRAEIATHVLVVRHEDRVGVLAHVLSALKDEQISVQEMENIVLGGAKAAIAQISVDKGPSEAALRTIRSNPHVFDVSVIALEREPAMA